MKYGMICIIVATLGLGACASSMLAERQDKVLKCVKELIEYNATPDESYKVCKDLYYNNGVQK